MLYTTGMASQATGGGIEVFKCKWGETLKLTQSNYHQWRPDMELFLEAGEALLIVLEVEEYPEEGDNTEANSWNKKIAKGAAMINVAGHSSVKPYIRHITDACKMWKTLAEKLDTTATRAGRCSLLRLFHVLRPTTSNKSPFGVTKYINQLKEFSNRLEGSNQSISDETFIAHLTTILPETFRNIIDIILHQPPTKQTLRKVISTLIEWEQSEETRHTASQLNPSTLGPIREIAASLNAEAASPSQSRYNFRSGSSYNRVGFNRSRGRVGKLNSRLQPNKSRIGLGVIMRSQQECWFCGKKGNIQRDCFKKRYQQRWSNDQKPNRGFLPNTGNRAGQADLAVVHTLTTSATTRIVNQPQFKFFHSRTTQLPFRPEMELRRIIDSGASHSLTPDKTLFGRLDSLPQNVAVTVGNGDTVQAIGRGMVRFHFSCGLQISIEALYVPGIHRSLLSVSQLNNYIPLTFCNRYC